MSIDVKSGAKRSAQRVPGTIRGQISGFVFLRCLEPVVDTFDDFVRVRWTLKCINLKTEICAGKRYLGLRNERSIA